MTNNVGKDVVRYKVTDPGDDTINPKPGTLRYEAILIPQKVWTTYRKHMNITLHKLR